MDLAVIAHHEAGHAVAHILVGHRFRYVTIRPRRQRATGRVAVHPRMVDAFPRAVTAYAGPEAEAHYLRGLGLDEHDVTAAIAFGACDDDFETAAAALPDKEQQTPANRTAKVLVGQCWP